MKIRDEKVISKLADIKIKMNTGIGMINEVKQAIIVGAGLSLTLKLSIFWGVITTIIAFFSFWVFGWIYIWFGLYQAEQLLRSSKYNPHLRKINELLEQKKKNDKQ